GLYPVGSPTARLCRASFKPCARSGRLCAGRSRSGAGGSDMIDYDTHARLADATAELMRSYAVAAAQTMAASAFQCLALWANMLGSAGRPAAPQVPRTASRNPFEAFWRFTPADWMPRAGFWPQNSWVPHAVPGFGWSPYTAWPAVADWSAWSRMYWPAWQMP